MYMTFVLMIVAVKNNIVEKMGQKSTELNIDNHHSAPLDFGELHALAALSELHFQPH